MDIEKLSSNEIKIKNRQRIYDYIRRNESVSKQDLVVALELSLPTVTQNLEYLKRTSLIDSSKKITNTGGRNATAFTYLKKAKMAIGIYITAHHMNGVAVDLSGDVELVIKKQAVFDPVSYTHLYGSYGKSWKTRRVAVHPGISGRRQLSVHNRFRYRCRRSVYLLLNY